MTSITIKRLNKYFAASKVHALRNINLKIAAGTHLCIMGPSGSGKSTLLKSIAGLTKVDSGEIFYDTANISALPAHRRRAAMVFQDHLLFPFLNVEENVSFGLRMQKMEKNNRKKRVAEILKLVDLWGYEKRKPHQLSGGQQQRIALARALVVNPQLLLLDEPLANLDTHLRSKIAHLIIEVQKKLHITTITVTHHQEEALLMGDTLGIIYDGAITQIGAADELYNNPVSAQVASFIGNWNSIEGIKKGGTFTTAVGDIKITNQQADATPEGRHTLFIQPQALSVVKKKAQFNVVSATVVKSYFNGQNWNHHLSVDNYRWKMYSNNYYEPHTALMLSIDPKAILLFKA